MKDDDEPFLKEKDRDYKNSLKAIRIFIYDEYRVGRINSKLTHTG